MLSPEKPLKILPGKPKPWSQPCNDVLEKQTQPNILSQPKKRVRINEIVANASNLKVNDLEVV